MIGILKHLFRKKRSLLECIKSHKNIFEERINFLLLDGLTERSVHLKIAAQEDYLNRLLNNEYHTDIFNYHIISETNFEPGKKCLLHFIPNNLKSELIILGYDFKTVKTFKKNFKHHTYILKHKTLPFTKNKTYKLYGVIGKYEIYIQKGHENGI